MMASLSRLSIPTLAVLTLAACAGFPPPTDESSQTLQAAQRPQFQNAPVSPRTRAEARTALALGYYERGQFDVALEELDEAMKLDNRYAMIYNGYGLVYAYLKEDAKASSNFQRAIELDPNNPEIRHNWGWFLCTSGRARESLAEFNRVALDPLYKTPEIAFTNAGRCALSINDKATARQYLERALSVRPDYPQAAYSLAELNYGEGKFNEARVMMRIIMQTPTPTADALFLGACIERKLNDKRAEDSYILQLQNRFPRAEQAERITRPGSCP
ncbi:MAG: type IV pilus biogenesis/stability protein PilW [Proteobacteria bacterium]|nr:type IV pilus biogenesis/stability protein PilW [Pseudomonadota bacterium]MCL2307779.1 type IV pilus biogenesis/stability protein PilW [Pseudomonadota bacterium]